MTSPPSESKPVEVLVLVLFQSLQTSLLRSMLQSHNIISHIFLCLLRFCLNTDASSMRLLRMKGVSHSRRNRIYSSCLCSGWSVWALVQTFANDSDDGHYCVYIVILVLTGVASYHFPWFARCSQAPQSAAAGATFIDDGVGSTGDHLRSIAKLALVHASDTMSLWFVWLIHQYFCLLNNLFAQQPQSRIPILLHPSYYVHECTT